MSNHNIRNKSPITQPLENYLNLLIVRENNFKEQGRNNEAELVGKIINELAQTFELWQYL